MTSAPPLHRLTRSTLVLAMVATLAACASSTRVTLLPQADGRPGAVEVRAVGGQRLINHPYQVATVGSGGALGVETTTAEKVREAYPRLLALQPPPPERFVLHFEPGSSQLTDESLAQLAAVVASAQARVGGEIIVTGHTDRQGTLEANDRLSLARAQAVRALLVERGFKPELIEAVGRGEREPVVPTEDEVVEPRNRRAEVLVR